MMKDRKSCLFLLFVWLLCSGNAINWQGTGNMSKDNMTVIWNYIDTNLDTSKTEQYLKHENSNYMVDLATNFSTSLNNQWGSAWNVFPIFLNNQINSDCVVYGYAFRSHWMWYNGIPMAEGKWVTFIIWKDYNCHTWFTYNDFIYESTTSYDETKSQEFQNLKSQNSPTLDLSDIWVVAQLYAQGMQRNTEFKNSAFSAITCQSYLAYISGRFCAVGYYVTAYIDKQGEGNSIFLQMR